MKIKTIAILIAVIILVFSLNGCLDGIRRMEHDEEYSNTYDDNNIMVKYSDEVNKEIVKNQAQFLMNLGVEGPTKVKIHQTLEDIYKVKIIDYESAFEGIDGLSVEGEGLAMMLNNQVYEGDPIELFLCDENGNVKKEFKFS